MRKQTSALNRVNELARDNVEGRRMPECYSSASQWFCVRKQTSAFYRVNELASDNVEGRRMPYLCKALK